MENPTLRQIAAAEEYDRAMANFNEKTSRFFRASIPTITKAQVRLTRAKAEVAKANITAAAAHMVLT